MPAAQAPPQPRDPASVPPHGPAGPGPRVRGHALVVDADQATRARLARLLARQGYSAATAATLREARLQWTLQAPDLLLLDTRWPEEQLQGLLASEELLDQGSMPAPPGAAPAPRPVAAAGPCAFIGRSLALQELSRQIDRVADTPLTVFICGETGTGKELVARRLHECSRRAGRRFVAVNCGALSPHLVESEFFGHERGSFTGAERAHAGWFEQADGGTLFLDEVCEMPPALQVKLLRVLESGAFMRVGGSREQACDVRVVAATHRDPSLALAQGLLREDLYFRLAVLPLRTPSLRERPEDIAPLAAHFLDRLGPREGLALRLSEDALSALEAHPWPGNVRELRNAMQRVWALASQETIDAAQARRSLQALGPG